MTEEKALAVTQSVEGLVVQNQRRFQEVLAGTMDGERFARVLCAHINMNKDLQRIAVDNPLSMISACMEMAQSGLDPSVPNEVFLVPMGKEAVCQYGYKGLAKLAIESAEEAGNPLKVLRADKVHRNDTYQRSSGDSPHVHHELPPFGEERGELLGFYAVAKDASGRVSFLERTVNEIEQHKKRFCKSKYGPWSDNLNFEAYGLKTVLRLLINKELRMGKRLRSALDNERDPLGTDDNEQRVALAPINGKKELPPPLPEKGPFDYDLSPLIGDNVKMTKAHEYLANGGARCLDEDMLVWRSDTKLVKAEKFRVSQ